MLPTYWWSENEETAKHTLNANNYSINIVVYSGIFIENSLQKITEAYMLYQGLYLTQCAQTDERKAKRVINWHNKF